MFSGGFRDDTSTFALRSRDTAGQERFRVITTTVNSFPFVLKSLFERIIFVFFKYYRDAAGVIVVYDVTNRETFSRICRWLDEIKKYCDDNIIKVLVGNKADVISAEDSPAQKVVSTEEAQQYAHEMNISFFETSAKDNKNVDTLFHTIARLALEQRLQARQKSQSLQRQDLTNGIASSQGIRLKGSKKKTSANCCK